VRTSPHVRFWPMLVSHKVDGEGLPESSLRSVD